MSSNALLSLENMYQKMKQRAILRFAPGNTEALFTHIYLNNLWGDRSSVSGPGSNYQRTQAIRNKIVRIIHQYNITSVLDIPCGDFHWMQYLDFTHIRYIGADIVKPLVQKNTGRYAKHNIAFMHRNILTDTLPRADLVLCRDCIVHFSINDIFTALRNIKRSRSKYILLTLFTEHRKNEDIVTGDWRPVNVLYPPFYFPKPIQVVNEECDDVPFKDKSLGLWRIRDIT